MSIIALVDDDTNISTSLSILLDSEGYQTQQYHDGITALQGIQHDPPDLVILDIKMPHMDGVELLRHVRRTNDVPMIFLTSKQDDIEEIFCLKLGADDFIRKPFSPMILVAQGQSRAAPCALEAWSRVRSGQGHPVWQTPNGPGTANLHLG